MEKIYLIQHSINEACKAASIFDIVSAHATKDKAWERLEEIKDQIENGTSTYFPNVKVKGELVNDILHGYTFGWKDDGGCQMYSHFMIIETTLD